LFAIALPRHSLPFLAPLSLFFKAGQNLIDKQREVYLNSPVILEILSLASEAFERGEKFIRYRIDGNNSSSFAPLYRSLGRIFFPFPLSFFVWLVSRCMKARGT
jgi:hypothetical protein